MESLNHSKKYKVHPKDPDVRGWEFEVDALNTGTVHDLRVNKYSMKVNYIDVIKKSGTTGELYHYLVPVSKVNIDEFSHKVRLAYEHHQFFDSYPRYFGTTPEDYEQRLKNYFHKIEHNNGDGNHNGTHNHEMKVERIHQDHSDGNSTFGEEYDSISNDHDNWEQKVRALEKQRKIKILELEKDLAIINKEIELLKAKSTD